MLFKTAQETLPGDIQTFIRIAELLSVSSAPAEQKLGRTASGLPLYSTCNWENIHRFFSDMPKAQKGKVVEKKKVIHPYSRKAGYLAREAAKQERKDRQKNEKALKLDVIGKKLLWFQDQLDPSKAEYTKQDACELIERYLHRFDSELEQIELANSIKGRKGRLHGSRENVIKQTIERERALYEGSGFEIPDIINTKHLRTFREWTGDLKKLPNIKMRKLSSESLTGTQKDAEESLPEDMEEDTTGGGSDVESEESSVSPGKAAEDNS
ncbi:translation machinery-associated protein 16 [Scleropages formosus]|uniref:Translation machinery-associated protein 16 n=1 Tax=Scleropages formosus TaxID=113540 RepID=A0A8C9RSE4_SCLFO|nr:translation machinery-associated protein 16 [Scleropages formosus]